MRGVEGVSLGEQKEEWWLSARTGGKMRGRVLGCGEAVKEGAIQIAKKTDANEFQGRPV
jgi:hypothetical protein